MARRNTQRRGAVRANRPRVEGLESRQLLAVTFGQFPLASTQDVPASIVTGHDGNLYFTVPGGNNGTTKPAAAIGVFDPFTHVTFDFPTPNPTGSLGQIVAGPNNTLWFIDNNTAAGTSSIGVFVPATLAMAEAPIAAGASGSLAFGGDGNLYFTNGGNGTIGEFNTTTGAQTAFPLSRTDTRPGAIVEGPDGNLWFGEGNPGRIAEFNATTHAVTEFTPPSNGAPAAIAVGPDGNIYFNEVMTVAPVGPGSIPIFDYRIAAINPTTGVITEYPGGNNGGITTGSDGNIWFTGARFSSIFGPIGTPTLGELNLATHTASSVPIPNLPGFAPVAIAAGADGNLYFPGQGVIGEATILPASQAVVSGFVALDPAGSAEAGNNPIAGQVVFLDLKGDGTLDPGDPSAVTDASGFYQIGGVAPGTYTVRLVASPGNTVTSPAGGSQSVTVVAGQNGAATPFTIVPTSIVLPLTYAANPFGAHNPDVSTAEVNGLYRTILGRAPTAAELSTVVGFLKNGTPVPAVASALLHSAEYDADFVTSDYRVFLGINPPAADVNAWVTMIQQQGLTAEQVAFDFMNTPDFNALHPGSTSFIQALYTDLLGRQATATEVSAWTSVLASGTTRAQAIGGILTSPLAAQREVDGLYAVFLGRPSDSAGLTFWVKAVESGIPLAVVAADFTGGSEFVKRANATVG